MKITSKDTIEKAKKAPASKKPSVKAISKPTVRKATTPKVSSKKTSTKKAATATKQKKVSSKKVEAKKVRVESHLGFLRLVTSPNSPLQRPQQLKLSELQPKLLGQSRKRNLPPRQSPRRHERPERRRDLG